MNRYVIAALFIWFANGMESVQPNLSLMQCAEMRDAVKAGTCRSDATKAYGCHGWIVTGKVVSAECVGVTSQFDK